MFLAISWKLSWWAWILIFLGILIVGFVIGMLVSKKITADYLEKHPLITEKTIRTMYQQMGRTPTEKQIRQVMAAMKQQK